MNQTQFTWESPWTGPWLSAAIWKKSAAKLGTRNNLLSKLAGSSWGAQASTLRTSASAICYSAAENCAPVWSRSSHTNMIDSQLNETMRITTGTLRPTPLPWLPMLSRIAPPHLRRQEATTKLLTKIELKDSLPLHKDIMSHPVSRLSSRRPIWQEEWSIKISTPSQWLEEWLFADM